MYKHRPLFPVSEYQVAAPFFGFEQTSPLLLTNEAGFSLLLLPRTNREFVLQAVCYGVPSFFQGSILPVTLSETQIKAFSSPRVLFDTLLFRRLAERAK